MTTVTIDKVEYNIEDFTEAATETLKIVQANLRITADKEHELQCLKAIGAVKVAELKQLLTGEEAPSDDTGEEAPSDD